MNRIRTLYLRYSVIYTLKNTEGAIKIEQSDETGNIWYKTKKENTHHYKQTNTNKVNKTWTLPQTTGGKDDQNIVNKTWTLPQTTGGKDDQNIVIGLMKFVIFFFFFWPLYYLSFDLWLLILPLWYLRFTVSNITPLVSYIYGF